jgi:hypothetical protein
VLIIFIHGYYSSSFLVDLTSQPKAQVPGDAPLSSPTATDDGTVRDQERGLNRPLLANRASSAAEEPEETELRTRNTPPKPSSIASSLRKRTSRLFGSESEAPASLPPQLVDLIDAYASSDLARGLSAQPEPANTLPDVQVESEILKGHKRASLWTQFRILSGRAFKNLYRDPALLATHYIAAFVLALIAGGLFYDVKYVSIRPRSTHGSYLPAGTTSAASRTALGSSSSR